ncbi:hypothetical protein CEXT_302601 [Caerostris extrusa]|uniref:Uncharacterized protein n=1 Tax=Caerostris extrusa TaxID=172846 RepID=A0AAV4VGJ3_CAEEX|nr:hypothetical protein CEXT_302601 [Caerostris extrusa]
MLHANLISDPCSRKERKGEKKFNPFDTNALWVPRFPERSVDEREDHVMDAGKDIVRVCTRLCGGSFPTIPGQKKRNSNHA